MSRKPSVWEFRCPPNRSNQQIKIKNLFNLIPDMAKYNKETQFIISKATEMFIQFYASKALEISTKLSQTINTNTNSEEQSHHLIEHTICGQHCFDALQTDHKLNFLRAVTVKPTNHKPAKPRRNKRSPTKKHSNKNTKKRDEEDIHDDDDDDDADDVVVSPSSSNTKPKTNKRGSKRKASSIHSSTSTSSNASSTESESNHKVSTSASRKKRRKLNADSESIHTNHAQPPPATSSAAGATPATVAATNQIITNHEYIHVPPPPHYYMNGYHPASAYYAHPYYAATHQPPPFASIATSIAAGGAPPSSQGSPSEHTAGAGTQHLTPTALYQPPAPFHPNTFYNPHQLTHAPPLPTTSASNGGSQIVNVQQIFGGDD